MTHDSRGGVPRLVHTCTWIHDQVMKWIVVNGWDNIQERLFDNGETDYTLYSKIEPHMVVVNAAKGIYLMKGHEV